MKHKIWFPVALLFFASCMKVKKKGDEDQTPVPVVTAKEDGSGQSLAKEKVAMVQREQITYRYLPSENQSVTKVQFFKPSNWPNSAIVKIKNNGQETQINFTFDQDGSWIDFISSEQKVTYQFFSDSARQEEVQVLPALNLAVSEDLNLAKKFELNDKTRIIYIRYLTVEASKHLYIEDFSGEIVIEKVETSDGIIQTFPTQVKANDGAEGKNGGLVNLKLLSGAGNLTLVMKGQDGGNGNPAAPPDLLLKGQAGGKGAHAKFEKTTIPISTGIDQGTSLDVYSCSVPPEKGGDGIQGDRGYPGDDGKKGGDSGTAIVENKSASLKVNLQSVVGKAGQGSDGGEGGEGGEPGPGGDGGQEALNLFLSETGLPVLPLDFAGGCPQGARGSKGGQGFPGKSGEKGTPGNLEKSCLTEFNGIVKCINE